MASNNNNNNDKEGVPMKSYNREKSTFKMVKYHVFVLLLLAILGLVLFLAGKFSTDSIPIILFFALLSIPLLIGFKDSLPDYIPKPVRNFLVTDEDKKSVVSIDKPFVTTKTKQIYLTAAMAVLSILLIMLIIEIYPFFESNVKASVLLEKRMFLKIISGVFLASFIGVLLINFDKMHNLAV
jgi:hypothetical protein